jgi:hypothetical protein
MTKAKEPLMLARQLRASCRIVSSSCDSSVLLLHKKIKDRAIGGQNNEEHARGNLTSNATISSKASKEH